MSTRQISQTISSGHTQKGSGRKKKKKRIASGGIKQSCSYLPLAGDHGVRLKMHSVVSYITRSCYALFFVSFRSFFISLIWFFLMYSCKTVEESFLFLYFVLPGIRSQCFSLITFSHPPSLLPPSLHRFHHTHAITRLSLLLSLVSTTEVTVWVFFPQATQPCFPVTVTPALPATLDPSYSQVICRRDNGKPPGHTLRHALRIQSCTVGTESMQSHSPDLQHIFHISKQTGMACKTGLQCDSEAN